MRYPHTLLLLLIISSHAHAAQFSVSKTADTADGACDSDCSLREAIIAANTNSEDDVIIVPAGTYTFARGGAGEDAASTGDLDITSPIVLTGAGQDLTIIDAASLDRVIHVHSPNLLAPAVVSLNELTLQNGAVDGEVGGAIKASEDTQLTLTNVTVQNSRAVNTGSTSGGGLGGGIHNNGLLKFTGGVIANNQADANSGEGRASFGGGGILNDAKGDATLTEVVIRGNSANNTSGNTALRFATGGGALNLGTMLIRQSIVGTRDAATATTDRNISLTGGGLSNVGGFLTVLKTAVAFNETFPAGTNEGRNGGGIYHQNAGNNLGKMVVTGSSIHNNTSAGLGGGISAASAPITVSNSAIYRNSAAFRGGGIATTGNVDSDITNTTLTENQAVQGGGIFTSSSFNIVSSTFHSNTASEAGAQIYILDPRVLAPESTRPNVTIANTIISHGAADPTKSCFIPAALATDNLPNDAFIKSGRFNIDTGSSCFPSDGNSVPLDTTNLINVTDTLLDTNGLLNNSDPNDALATPTIATAVGSRARERADLASCPGNDQRFYRRQNLCDVGAYEADGILSAVTTSDLEVRIREQADIVYAGFGSQAVYTVTVFNKGPDEIADTLASGVISYDNDNDPNTIPATFPTVARVSVVEGDERDAQCEPLAAPTVGFRCTITRLAASRFISIAIALDTPNPGALGIKAEAIPAIAGTDPFLPNNVATESSTVKATGEAPPTVNFPSSGGGGAAETGLLLMTLLGLRHRYREKSRPKELARNHYP